MSRALDNTAHLRRCPGSMSTIMQNPLARGNFYGMKSHDWITMLGPVGVYYYQCLGVENNYKLAFQSFFWWLYELRAPRISRARIESNMYSWERWGIECMALIEPLMPDDFMTINFHLFTHLCSIIRKYGPLPGHWMMKDERYHHIMKSMLHSHKNVEETLMRAVVEFEHVTWNEDDDDISLVLDSVYRNVFDDIEVAPIRDPTKASDSPTDAYVAKQFYPWKRERRTPAQIVKAESKVKQENKRRKEAAVRAKERWRHLHVFFMNHGDRLIGQLHDEFKKLFAANNEWKVSPTHNSPESN